jgi:hypothetical protein
MRWPRVRFTVRRLMIAVAAVGIGLWIGQRIMWGSPLARAYRIYVDIHSRDRDDAEEAASVAEGLADEHAVRKESEAERRYRDDAGHLRTKAAYHADLIRKYARAARYPWLTVEPDPPEPE